MDRIKKFYRDHEEEITSGLLVVTGLSAMFCGAVAIYKIKEVEGLRIKDVDVSHYSDGIEEVRVNLMNGKVVGGTVNF